VGVGKGMALPSGMDEGVREVKRGRRQNFTRLGSQATRMRRKGQLQVALRIVKAEGNGRWLNQKWVPSKAGTPYYLTKRIGHLKI
jgi:hypothetical protein